MNIYCTTPIHTYHLKVFNTRYDFQIDSYRKSDAFPLLQYLAKLSKIDVSKYYIRYYDSLKTWILYKTEEQMIND